MKDFKATDAWYQKAAENDLHSVKKVTFQEYITKKLADYPNLTTGQLKVVLDAILKRAEKDLKKYEKYLEKT